MATIAKRTDSDGKTHYQVKVRLKGYPQQTATFNRLTDAKKWATQTEAAIRERPPKRTDEWYSVIRDLTSAFLRTHRHCPNQAQAWARLWEDPPPGYEIAQAACKDEDAVSMSGKLLSRAAFAKRWARYTKPKARQ